MIFVVLKRYINKNWFKIRNIYSFKCDQRNPFTFISVEGFAYDVEKKDSILGEFFVFRMSEKNSGKTISLTNIAINSKYDSLWHDNYSISNNTGLVYGSYVVPEFRGRGFYVNLLSYSLNYFKSDEELRIKEIVAIVESSNYASAKSHNTAGFTIVKKNYLLKFLGRNILSIYTNPLRCYFAKKKSNSF